MSEHILITRKPQEFVDITGTVRKEVEESGVSEGMAFVFIPHTTAGVTINENADPDVTADMISGLNKVIPVIGNYKHFEGNSHAHIKSSLMGSSCCVIIEDGKLKLGTWQAIYFCEFDGPRHRKFYTKVSG
jgi:secondary thiamine-phosphate synthase enzyme